MAGTDFAAVGAVRAATGRRVSAAGGITTNEEIGRLSPMGVDAVVGMAIYTGRWTSTGRCPVEVRHAIARTQELPFSSNRP
jgi:phosphoribosylformimino-5-aminoimidazole carboxamide ribonucleotide (ProFAR) isomerase